MNHKAFITFYIVLILSAMLITVIFFLFLFTLSMPIENWGYIERLSFAVISFLVLMVTISKYSDIKTEIFDDYWTGEYKIPFAFIATKIDGYKFEENPKIKTNLSLPTQKLTFSKPPIRR